MMSKKKNSDGEFEGYVKAKLEDIASNIKEIKDSYKEQVVMCDARFCKIEESTTDNKIGLAKVGVIIGGASIVLSIVISKIIDAIFK